MHRIRIEPKSREEHTSVYEVTVGEAGDITTHIVTVPASYYQKLTGGKVEEVELVRRSFEFLLDREPKESILRQFDLPAIQRYFDDYEQEISRFKKEKRHA